MEDRAKALEDKKVPFLVPKKGQKKRHLNPCFEAEDEVIVFTLVYLIRSNVFEANSLCDEY
jgi:hypothetical protein